MKIRNIGWMFFFASLASVVTVFALSAGNIPVPQVGDQHSIEWLSKLINTNNPGGTSKFFILTNKGSQSADLSAYANQVVTLKQDLTRINQLFNAGVLNATTKSQYAKILLYFTLPNAPAPYNTAKIYINDPNPGKIVKAAGITRNPAANIIAKWAI